MKIEQLNSPNQSSRGNCKPCLICWHIADGTYEGTKAWETNPTSNVSSHFVLGENGEVAQLVPLTKAAWTQGIVKNPTHPYVKAHANTNPNQYCISIECAGFWRKTKGKLTQKQLESAIELTKHIVSEVKRLYGVTIPINREHMIGHCEINSVSRPHCPGELFPYDELINMTTHTKPTQTLPEHPLSYTVQVGAFQDERNAQGLKNELAGKGYFTFITHAGKDTKVCVGRFKTKEEAERTVKDLKKKGFAGFATML